MKQKLAIIWWTFPHRYQIKLNNSRANKNNNILTVIINTIVQLQLILVQTMNKTYIVEGFHHNVGSDKNKLNTAAIGVTAASNLYKYARAT